MSTIVVFKIANIFNSTGVHKKCDSKFDRKSNNEKKLVVLWHKMKAIWLFLAMSNYNLRFIRISERGMWFGPFMAMLNFGQWFLYVSGIVCDHFWALEVTTACVWWMTSYLENELIICLYGEKIALKPRVAPFFLRFTHSKTIPKSMYCRRKVWLENERRAQNYRHGARD